MPETAAPPQQAQPSSSATPQADTASHAAQQAGPVIPVTLDKSIDSKKAKAGDEIVAKLSVPLNDTKGDSIPKGSKVIGHVVDSKAKSKGDSQSSLAFAFEKIEVKGGKDVPFHAIAQAIGAAPSNNPGMMPADTGGPQSPEGARGQSGPAMGGQSGATGGGGQAGPPASPGSPGSGAPQMGANNSGALPQNATGVVGIKGLNLESQNNASVVSSDSKSVKLDSGTQMLLKMVSQ
jgi:hypothetical protein